MGTVALWVLVAAVPLEAQTIGSAAVSGRVRSADGGPVDGAVVTLTALGVGGSHETTSDASGSFSFALVAPGSYEVRAEALGYRPVVARPLIVAGGERSSVSLTLTAAPPPVLTIDTVTLAGSSSSHWRAGGVHLGTTELDDLPHRFEDLTSTAALSSAFDDALGVQGLPGAMTVLMVDGLPVYRAPSPLSRSEQLSGGIFTRSVLSGVTAYQAAPDVEWSGSAAGYLSMATRSGTRDGGVELDGAWSGDPLWSSSELDFSTPSLTSFQGSVGATIPVTPDVSQLVVIGEGFQQETPLDPRLSEVEATSLSGLDSDLVGSLSAPGVERLSRFSGLARFDQQYGSDSRLFVRSLVGYSKREFEGSGPVTLARHAAPPEEDVDYSAAAGFTSAVHPGVVFDVRLGVSGSSRKFDPSAGAEPSAILASTGAMLGTPADVGGESSRTDIVLLPTVRYDVGLGTLKAGLSVRAARQTMASAQPSAFVYSDPAALVAGQGAAYGMDAPEVTFSTRELGAFAQYDVEPSPGFRLTLGGRFDYEITPGSDVTLDTDWLQASGLRNDDYPSRFAQPSAVASLTWDPARDGNTTVFGTASLQHGDLDPRLISQLLSQDGVATSSTYAGSGLDWPMSAFPTGATTLPTLTLFGPDTRAPRSTDASGGIVQRVTGGLNVFVGGSYRRTDFLMRRRNLNLPLLPQAVDAYGRDVYGTLQQDGALVTAFGSDARRFSGFNQVWALDPDGWSKYWGATAGLEYSGSSGSLYVSYTHSKTTDNWIGASGASVEAELSPGLPVDGWSEGTSDFDVPDRVAAGATARVSIARLSAVYRYRSGLPFTPGYRTGVDANGDASFENDVAYVDAGLVDPLLGDWPCLSDQVDGFAERNSCRGPAAHSLDVRLALTLGRIMGRDASLVLDAFNLIETKDGVIDNALLLVDPTSAITTSSGGSTVTIPVMANPDFGRVLYPSTRGRMIRIGFRIG